MARFKVKRQNKSKIICRSSLAGQFIIVVAFFLFFGLTFQTYSSQIASTERPKANNIVQLTDEFPNVELSLYRISAPDGKSNTAEPGAAKKVFFPADTIRITLRADNTGKDTKIAAVLNIPFHNSKSLLYDSHDPASTDSGAGEDNSPRSPLRRNDGYGYYSFDKIIPKNSPLGEYDVLAAIRNQATWSEVLDTLAPGRNDKDWANTLQRNVFTISKPSITDYSIDLTTKKQGETLALNYSIDNPSDTVRSMKLGATLVKMSDPIGNIEDAAYDLTVDVPAMGGDVKRKLPIPIDATPGEYRVMWGLWDLTMKTMYDLKVADGYLTIEAKNSSILILSDLNSIKESSPALIFHQTDLVVAQKLQAALAVPATNMYEVGDYNYAALKQVAKRNNTILIGGRLANPLVAALSNQERISSNLSQAGDYILDLVTDSFGAKSSIVVAGFLRLDTETTADALTELWRGGVEKEPGFIISSIEGNTSEANGGKASFSLALTKKPTADVTI